MDDRDDLLRYYRDELTYLRRAGREFARLYPKVASRLELSEEGSADPHVERLIESFAFLSARLQRRLDLEFPEISGGLLNVLYPHLTQPAPPLSVARFEPDPDNGKLTTGHLIPRGARLFAQASDGVTCRFRTCYPVELWPLEVAASDVAAKSDFAFLNFEPRVRSVIQVKLRCTGDLSKLPLSRLRFFLNGDAALTSALYDLLFGSLEGIALYDPETRQEQRLAASALMPVGLGEDEDVIPSPPATHPGYRLLEEYLHFPAKFLFFDVDGLDRRGPWKTLDLLFLLGEAPKARLACDHTTFLLGCTPIANLFTRTSEPVRIDQRRTEYRLVADHRREHTTEIHSILTVSASSDPAKGASVVEPFFSFRHGSDNPGRTAFWHARRLPVERADMAGTDVWLSFHDLAFRPSHPAEQVVYAHMLCTNRDLAGRFPAGAKLQTEDAVPAQRISAVMRPTPTLYPPSGGAALWQLVSNLSLNHLSLGTGDDSLKALREILRIFNFGETPFVNRQIEGIAEMRTRPVVARMGADLWRGFCRGTEVTLVINESQFVGASPVMFASVLRQFFGLYAAVNSFTQLILESVQRGQEWKRWPPLAGWRQVF